MENNNLIDLFLENKEYINNPYTILFSKMDEQYLHYIKKIDEIDQL